METLQNKTELENIIQESQNILQNEGERKIRLDYYSRLIFISWTLLVVALIVIASYTFYKSSLQLLHESAKQSINKDLSFRYWATMHGGVYVPVTDTTTPNPYLIVPERDITTPSGKKLTLMNPAYMTRQVGEIMGEKFGTRVHITSLNPIRPQNKADEWESAALHSFEKGMPEATGLFRMKDTLYYRLMLPMITKKGCLKCHAVQGYKEGDIRGGLSVSISTYSEFNRMWYKIIVFSLSVLLLWIIGGWLLLYARKIIKNNIKQLQRTNTHLKNQNDAYLSLNEEFSTANEELMQTNQQIHSMVEELQKARDKAEASDKLKTAFLANMSHEIRTPMNAILGFASLLGRKDLPEEKKTNYIRIINSNANHLLDIINDILDISKIEAGLIVLSNTTVNINTLLNELKILFESDIEIKQKENLGIKLNYALPDSNALIETDQLRLRQILINLISNAVKFTDEGEIEIGYEIQEHNWIKFFVKDTGIGIAPEKLGLIFDRFRQGDENTTKKFGGTGLGLAISKGLVQLFGGKIWCKSFPGKGSVFYFTIPYNSTNLLSLKKQNNQKAEQKNWSDKTILIVEDVFSNYQLLVEILQPTKARILYAGNGREAVRVCLESKINIVLMDIQMPVMNGYEASKKIKDFLPDLSIVALTAYAQPDEKERILDAGCDDYLSKPVKPDELIAVISKWVE